MNDERLTITTQVWMLVVSRFALIGSGLLKRNSKSRRRFKTGTLSTYGSLLENTHRSEWPLELDEAFGALGMAFIMLSGVNSTVFCCKPSHSCRSRPDLEGDRSFGGLRCSRSVIARAQNFRRRDWEGWSEARHRVKCGMKRGANIRRGLSGVPVDGRGAIEGQ